MSPSAAMPEPKEVLAFWFEETPKELWFRKDEAFDTRIRARFGAACEAALAGGLEAWESTPDGLLALILLLDQFPRNLFRGQAKAFAGDARAVALTLAAIKQGWDAGLETPWRQFLYMPLMHSEDSAIQLLSIERFATLGDANTLDFAHRHKRIIDRFGRYPHRNAALGRPSSAEELAFLQEPGSAF